MVPDRLMDLFPVRQGEGQKAGGLFRVGRTAPGRPVSFQIVVQGIGAQDVIQLRHILIRDHTHQIRPPVPAGDLAVRGQLPSLLQPLEAEKISSTAVAVAAGEAQAHQS